MADHDVRTLKATTLADPVSQAAAPLLTRGIELNQLLCALVDAIVAAIGADRGTLYLVDGAQRTLTAIIANAPTDLPRIELALGQGIAGAVARDGVPISVVDAGADARFDATFDQRTGYRTRSVLAVPLHDSAREVIGVLQLLNAARGSFSADDVTSALTLAAQAGAVLERTSLHVELSRRGRLEGERPALAFRFNQIVGESDAMKRVYALVEKAARTDATVLLTGESGTGKELIARAIHVNSPRKAAPFVKVDCTTLPEHLIENELFGHERGAFTGADKATPGKLDAAAGGTLFLDEIGELPLQVQGKLLRVLQDREYERVGGTKTLSADIRVICATHRPLARMIDDGLFREDLYYRVRVVPVHLPPLRERGRSDVLRLVEHFVDRYARRHHRPNVRLGDDAVERLVAHEYPGNIRELEHVIESAIVLCDGDLVTAADIALPERRAKRTEEAAPVGDVVIGDPEVPLSVVEREHIRLVLERVAGNQSEAARRLGIGRNTLARKLEEDG